MPPWTAGKKKKAETTDENLIVQAISTPNQQLERTANPNNGSNKVMEPSQSRTRPVFEIDPTEGEYHLKILRSPEEAVVEYVLFENAITKGANNRVVSFLFTV